MKRREFTKAVRVEIVRRATRNRSVFCEGCGVACQTWHIDHTIPDGLHIDKSKPLTADDGKLLCAGSRETCHGRKTAEHDQPTIAKAKRNEARHLGLSGKPTQLSGRTRDQINADKEARRSARGSKPSLTPRSLFRDARPLALPAPATGRRG